MPLNTTDPDLIAACLDARTTPEALLVPECPTVTRRAVACRLLDARWRPGKVAVLLGVSRWTLRRWMQACPARYDTRAWRPPPGVSDTPHGRKLRRVLYG